MKTEAGLVILGQDTLTDLTGLIDRAFREKDDSLAELLVRTTGNQIRCMHIRMKPSFQLLCLNLKATRADDIVETAQNAETAFRGEFCHIMGDEAPGTDLRGIDDQTAFVGKTDTDRRERRIDI